MAVVVPLVKMPEAVTVQSLKFNVPVTLIVKPVVVSKNTLSALVGTEAPDAPPVVADQLVVLLQAPVPPPTQ